MSYYRFNPEDIINSSIVCHPKTNTELNGNQVTGSIYLEKQYLNNDLETREWQGSSDKEGGLIKKNGPFTSSVDFFTVVKDGTNKELYQSIVNLYNEYSIINSDYTGSFTGSETTRFRVVSIPSLYYDKSILSGTFTASDHDNAGAERKLYDNGRGGLYSGSVTGTLVGNVFYREGIAVLKGGGLQESGNDFGEDSSDNFKWKFEFKGVHKIPVKIFRCRARGGELNASTNPSYFYAAASGSRYNGENVRVLSSSDTYVSKIGLYNDRYELCAVAHLSQPIRKKESQSILFRVRLDW